MKLLIFKKLSLFLLIHVYSIPVSGIVNTDRFHLFLVILILLKQDIMLEWRITTDMELLRQHSSARYLRR